MRAENQKDLGCPQRESAERVCGSAEHRNLGKGRTGRCRPAGKDTEQREPEQGLQAGQSQQGSAGNRRDDHRGGVALVEGES